MKKLLLLLLFPLLLMAQSKLIISKVSTENIGPGVKLLKYQGPRPIIVHVVEVDLTNQMLSLKAVPANEKTSSFETLSSMNKRYSKPGNTVLAAINADFFDYGTGLSLGLHVTEGEFIKAEGGYTYSMGFSNQNKPFMALHNFTGSITHKGKSFDIATVNPYEPDAVKSPYYDNLKYDLVMFNKYKSNKTGATAGKELLLKPLSKWEVNNGSGIRCQVIGKGDANSQTITDSNVIILARNAGADFLSNININDEVLVNLSLTLTKNTVKELIGVYPRIVVNGINWSVPGSTELYDDPAITPDKLYSECALGFNRDSTKLYIVNSDDKNPVISKGITIREMADFMIDLGVYNAGHFDSGGSAELIVRDSIVSCPQIGERAIVNAFFVCTNAPTGKLNSIQVSPDQPRLSIKETVQLSVKGYDQYFNTIPIDNSKIKYTLSKNSGKLTADGFYTAEDKTDTIQIFVEYSGYKDTVTVYVKGVKTVTVYPKKILISNSSSAKLVASSFDSEGIGVGIDPNQYKWTSSNPQICRIDTMGSITGIKDGKVFITAEIYGAKDTAVVEVKNLSGSASLHRFDNLTGWTINGDNVDSLKLDIVNDPKGSSAKVMKVSYKFKYSSSVSNTINILKNIDIEGVPDSLSIVALSNGVNHHISFFFSDDDGELFRNNTTKYFNDTSWNNYPILLSKMTPLSGGKFYFPAKFNKIYVVLGSAKVAGTTYEGSFYLKEMNLTYQKLNSIKNSGILKDGSYMLGNNYPNPFNPTTNINFSVPENAFVNLSVYNVLGEKIQELVNSNLFPGSYTVNFNASGLPSGVYFYKISTNSGGRNGGFAETKKMLLIK